MLGRLARWMRFLGFDTLYFNLLIKANDSFHQLIEVIDTLKLSQFNPLSRCVVCNGMLTRVMNKHDIKDSVPEFIFLNMNVFLECTECGKIYWEGTHPKKFKEKLDKIIN
jgi:uncharacterized protein with PIN domain